MREAAVAGQRMPRVTGADLLRALRRDGWYVARVRGSHHLLNHPSRPGRPNIPVHAGAILDPAILKRILTEVGLTADELRDLL
jgi:predicted RNA binding protein YcfA (HicA-like mRNA interferase family)